MTMFWNRIRRAAGFFPRVLWRLALRGFRRESHAVARGRLSPCAGFSLRSEVPAPPEFFPALHPDVARAAGEVFEAARERFASGRDLAPLAGIAEAGASIRAFVIESAPAAPEIRHLACVYPATIGLARRPRLKPSTRASHLH